MSKIPKAIIQGKIKRTRFLFKRRPKSGTISKIDPILVTVYVNDVTTKPSTIKQISVYSEVHSSIQDLVATLFRRGVVDADTGTIYAGGSIVKVVPDTKEAKEEAKAELKGLLEISEEDENLESESESESGEELEAEI